MAAQPPAPERASVTSVPVQAVASVEAAAPAPPIPRVSSETPIVPGFPADLGSRPQPDSQQASRRRPASLLGDQLVGMPRWALLACAAAMLVLLAGLAVFVVLPAFFAHQARSQWTDTSVSLPAQVADLKRVKGTQVTALTRTMAANGVERSSVGVYGTIGKNAVILVASKPANPFIGDDQRAQREAMQRSLTTASKVRGFALTEQKDAGPLGGYLGCGTAPNSTVTICLATDAGSVVGTISGPTVKDPAALTRTAREAAVKHTP